MFGNTSSLFGQTQAPNQGSGLFGSQPQTQPNQNQGGLFGTQNQTQPGQNQGGLFGTQSQAGQSQSGLFGAPKPGGGLGLFGSSTGVGTTAGTGLFGSSSGSTGLTGLFGNTSGQQASASSPQTSSLFGHTTSSQNPATGTGLFGTTGSSNTGLFGQTQSQNQNQNQNQNQGYGLGLFGNSSGLGLGLGLGQSSGQGAGAGLVNVGAHPTIKDLSMLHPDLAASFKEIDEFIRSNEKSMREISSAFAEVTDVAAATKASFKSKKADSNLIIEEIEQAEEILQYLQPSNDKLKRLASSLEDDVARLDSGLVAVPAIEHAELINDAREKIMLLTNTVDSLRRILSSLEADESTERKIVNYRKTLAAQQEHADRLTKFAESAEAANARRL